MERLGLTIGLDGGSMKAAIDLIVRAEGLGFTDAWTAEVGGTDGFSPLAAVARSAPRLRLGTAIVPVFTRPPALLAMHAATLQDVSEGRFVLGIGTSSSIIVEYWMGGSFNAPLTRLAEYVRILRAALSGEKVDFDGRTVSLKSFRLQHEPGAPVPIYVAALGPQACRLAGEIGDGVVFFLKSPEGVAQAMEWVAEGAQRAGRDHTELDVVIRLPTFVGDPGSFSGAARRLITSYAIVDVYNRSLQQQGFAEAGGIAEAFWSGDRKRAASLVSDEMIARLLPTGDSERCIDLVDEFRKAGIVTPVLLPLSAAEDADEKMADVAGAVEDLAGAQARRRANRTP